MDEGMCLEPDYYEDFSCDGVRCGARCCREWAIPVDAGTYVRYREMAEPQRTAILSKLVASDEAGPYRLDFGRGGSCPFLRPDQLCTLHREYGEEYIGDTCALYPRKIMQIGGAYERSLSLSCPLAAELALWRAEPISFREKPLSRSQVRIIQQFAVDEESVGVAAAFRLLQENCIFLLQQKLPWELRLGRLLDFLTQSDEAVGSGDFAVLLDVANLFRQSTTGRPAPALAARRQELREMFAAHIEEKGYSPRGQSLTPRGMRPCWDVLRENYLVAEFFIGLYPACLEGSLRHNGEVLLALAALLEDVVGPLFALGQDTEILEACVRLSFLSNHDKDWLEKISAFVAEKGLTE